MVTVQRRRSIGGLNQLIARTYQLNNQLIGLQLTLGNMVAVLFSAAQITLGMICVLWGRLGFWAIGMVLVCFPLAVIVERFSLGGLIVLREATAIKMRLEDEYNQKLLKVQATEAEQQEFERQKRRLVGRWWMSVLPVVFGVIVSAVLGDQWWSWVFGPVGGWMGMFLSLSCAVAVSLTFVFSELYRDEVKEGVVELVRDARVPEAVLVSEGKEIKRDLSLQAYADIREDAEKNEREVVKIEQVLSSDISEFAKEVKEVGLEGGLNGSGMALVGGGSVKQLPARAKSKRRFEECRDDLEWLLRERAGLSYQVIAERLGVSKSTARAWVMRLREEQDHQVEGSVTPVVGENGEGQEDVQGVAGSVMPVVGENGEGQEDVQVVDGEMMPVVGESQGEKLVS